MGGWQKPISKSQFQFSISKSSPELKFPLGGGGGVGRNQFLTSDAESKFAKI